MKKSLIALSIVAALSATAQAENLVDGKFNTVTGDDVIVSGAGNAVTGTDIAVEGDSNTAAGIHMTVAGKLNVAAGHEVIVNGNQSVVMGPHAVGNANIVTAVGSGSYVGAYSGTAVGKGAVVGDDGDAGTAIGAHATAAKGSTVAVGFHANALGGSSTALGTATKAEGDQSTAVGNGATSTGRFSTAVGQNAKATNNHDVAIGSGSVTKAAVGTVNAEVNGVKFGNFAAQRPKAEASVGSEGFERTVTNVAAGRVTAESTDAINGSQLYAVATKVAENVKGVKANADSIKALDGKVDKNTREIESINRDFITLKDEVANNANSITGNTEQIGNLNKAVQAQNAWNTAQDEQIAENKAVIATNASGIAGNKKQIGDLTNVVNNNTTAIEKQDRKIGQLDIDMELLNAKHDEWNRDQDKAIAGLQNGVNANAAGIASNTEKLNNLTELVQGLSGSEARLKKEIHDARRESRAGIAGANAIAAIPQPHAAGQTAIGAGAGYFKNEGAIALGVSHISKSGKWVSKAGVNFDTRKNVGAAIGVSYVFGGVAAQSQPVVVKEVVREVIVREVQPAPETTKIRG